MLGKLQTFFTLVGAAWNSDSIGAAVSAALKYGPLILSMVEAFEKNKTDEQAQKAATEIERGFRALSETNDPTLLEQAVRSHCTASDGCLLP